MILEPTISSPCYNIDACKLTKNVVKMNVYPVCRFLGLPSCASACFEILYLQENIRNVYTKS